jgi:ribosomal protein L6P/L9E
MEIRKLRIPNPYTGKGIHFAKEIIKLKKGKREGK